jgi:predicted glycoside hydrolase/deacetylase ChbG (UPF0249 family)
MTGPSVQPSPRRLIVNADDFGQSAGINEGIIRCHERGILTSASLMVLWPHASAAAEYAKSAHALSVGLHLDFGEWAYRNGEWTTVHTVLQTHDPAAVKTEVTRQLDMFRRLTGSDPTHLDSHQHVHCSPPFDRIVADVGVALGVPVRRRTDAVRYEGSFYGQDGKGAALDDAITVERFIAILRTLPVGTTEMGCHPGLGHDSPGMYVAERERETTVLCDRQLRAAVEAEGIQLISFRDVAACS